MSEIIRAFGERSGRLGHQLSVLRLKLGKVSSLPEQALLQKQIANVERLMAVAEQVDRLIGVIAQVKDR